MGPGPPSSQLAIIEIVSESNIPLLMACGESSLLAMGDAADEGSARDHAERHRAIRLARRGVRGPGWRDRL